MIDQKLERLSAAVSLTVLELDFYRHELIPAYLLANLMSPVLWNWRTEKRAYDKDEILLSPKNRLSQLQRFLHRYNFTSLPNEPGGDPWGLLNFDEEEKRFGTDFINSVKTEYDETLKKLLAENPESQFGQIVNQPYYKKGFFPRLKNEIVEVMNAFSLVDPEGRGSGKCAALTMLWAAALMVWGRFSPDKVTLIGNRAHTFLFLDEEEGHLLNNAKWFSNTRINNQSELSEFVKIVSSSAEATFFYNPSQGICNCTHAKSEIPHHGVSRILTTVSSFVSNSIKHPSPDDVHYMETNSGIPNPLEFVSTEDYQASIFALAEKYPDSIFDFAQYAFRSIDVPYPQVYLRAAGRDYQVRKLAQNINNLDDALRIISNIQGQASIFANRQRIGMPDETLFFNSGSDRDRALLLYTLFQNSLLGNADDLIGFTNNNSFVFHSGKWIDLNDLSVSSNKPLELQLILSCEFSEKN